MIDEVYGPDPDTTTSTTNPAKRKRGQRSSNRYPTCHYVITEVGSVGEPLQPRENCVKFRNAVRAMVRDELNPAIQSWP